MAGNTRIIKARIKSVKNTRKITKAMELVAGAKMRRAVQMTVDSRHYSSNIKAIVDNVRTLVNQKSHPLLYGRKVSRKTMLIVAASDRGLCGSFNVQLIKKTSDFISERKEQVRIITVGKKVEAAFRRRGFEIIASFPSISNAPSFERSKSVGSMVYHEFVDDDTDRVFLCYSDFQSTISQVPTIVQLLPIIPEDELESGPDFPDDDLPGPHGEEELDMYEQIAYDRKYAYRYLRDQRVTFEPTPRIVLENLLPRLIDTRLYQAMLESTASEHSARMMAMRNATDSASEMIDGLTLTFNRARQAGITAEISEISAGKAALED